MEIISHKRIVSTVIFCIVNLLLFLFLSLGKLHIALITYFAIFQLVLSLYLLKVNKGTIFSINAIFIILSFFFHFGQTIIISFGFNDIYSHRSVLNITSVTSVLKALKFTIISHFFLTLGMVWCNNSRKTILIIQDDEDIMLKRLRNISVIVLVITLFPLIYLDLLKISAVKLTGYVSTYATYTTGINKYLYLFAQFARPSITLFLISNRKDLKKANLIFRVSSVYFIIMMISGDRGTNIIYLLTNIFVYYKIIKSLKIKNIIILVILGYFFMGLVSSISILRDSFQISIASLIKYYKYRSADGIIYSVLREFGLTLKTLIYSIDFTSASADYNYGATYIFSWLTLSPKLPQNLVNSLITDFTFVKSFPSVYQESLGGSYLGELFYNFGWIGSIFSFFVGKLIGHLDNQIENSIHNKNWVVFSILMILFPNLLLWVRGYFVELIFRVFWLGSFVLFVYKVLKKYQNQKYI